MRSTSARRPFADARLGLVVRVDGARERAIPRGAALPACRNDLAVPLGIPPFVVVGVPREPGLAVAAATDIDLLTASTAGWDLAHGLICHLLALSRLTPRLPPPPFLPFSFILHMHRAYGTSQSFRTRVLYRLDVTFIHAFACLAGWAW